MFLKGSWKVPRRFLGFPEVPRGSQKVPGGSWEVPGREVLEYPTVLA
jgi:hypothetical protein